MPYIKKGVDASGQPYTMIVDRKGTRYEYPEGKDCWSGFKNPNQIGGIGFCKVCQKHTHVTGWGDSCKDCE